MKHNINIKSNSENYFELTHKNVLDKCLVNDSKLMRFNINS